VVCCLFYWFTAPFLMNLPGAVRARDVMVNEFYLRMTYE